MYYTCHICGDSGKDSPGWLEVRQGAMDCADLRVEDMHARVHLQRQLHQNDADQEKIYEQMRNPDRSLEDLIGFFDQASREQLLSPVLQNALLTVSLTEMQ